MWIAVSKCFIGKSGRCGASKGARTPIWGQILQESTIYLAGTPAAEVALRRSPRARRLSLRVSSLDGRVTLTVPSFVTDREARRFVDEKQTWIRRNLAEIPHRIDVATAERLPFEGAHLPVVHKPTRAVRISDGAFIVPQDPDRQAKAVGAFLKHAARDRLAAASQNYADQIGRRYSRLSLRDTRSRWGSCSSAGALMYSWRLIMAPAPVLDYVAAHEVAHLEHLHHGPDFWAVVRDLCPDVDDHRGWLRQNGSQLHMWDFGN